MQRKVTQTIFNIQIHDLQNQSSYPLVWGLWPPKHPQMVPYLVATPPRGFSYPWRSLGSTPDPHVH